MNEVLWILKTVNLFATHNFYIIAAQAALFVGVFVKLTKLVNDIFKHSHSNVLAVQIISVIIEEQKNGNEHIRKSLIIDKLHNEQSLRSFTANVTREARKMIDEGILNVAYLDENNQPTHSNHKDSATYTLTEKAKIKYKI